MASGGRRKGQPGKAYPNRTDLMAQPVKTGPSQQYGQATQLEAQQQAIPLPTPTPLHAPSARPDEHPMTGVPSGPGAGPEALVHPPVDFTARGPLTARDRLQMMLQQAQANGQPYDDLALLISRLGW